MINNAQQAPLWRQLLAVSAAVQAIRCGTSANTALNSTVPELRPGVQALLFQVLRSLGRAQALRELLVKRTPAPAADALLCTALALLWRGRDAPYDGFTLVNQAVEAAKRSSAMHSQANFVNACLRRFLRQSEELLVLTEKNPLAVWNHPAWWVMRLKQDWPAYWQAILQANQEQAPLTLRVNTKRVDLRSYLMTLQEAGMNATAAGKWGLSLESAKSVHEIPGFLQGLVSVQDAAAQLASGLLLSGLTATKRLRILDACAAPGGKTAHLLELQDCEVTALDIDAGRCERIHETLKRLGLNALVRTANAADVNTWWDGQCFDAVMLDAPCSASGIVRRHPDISWLRRESDIPRLAAVQARLLEALWPVVSPGGRLLYCTCSVFKAEGANQIETFLANNTDAALLTSPGHLFPRNRTNGDAVRDNLACDHDGFFYALLEKRAP